MTIFQIISPNGVKVCRIKAVSKYESNKGTRFYNYVSHFYNDDFIADIPSGWVSIPLDVIVAEN